MTGATRDTSGEKPPMRAGLRRVLTAAVVVAVAAVLAGCAPPARRPTPSTPSSGGGIEPGKEIEGIVRSRDRSKRPVHAFVLGNVAVVGLGSATARPAPGPATPGLPPATAPARTRTTAPSAAPPTGPATPPTGTTAPPATPPTPAGTPPRPGATTGVAPAPSGTPVYTPRPGSVNVLDRATVAAIRRKLPFVARVLSTNDAVLVGRIAALVRDVRARRPVDARVSEIADIIRALSGPVPAPGGGAPPTGTPAPAPMTPAAPPAGTPPAAPR